MEKKKQQEKIELIDELLEVRFSKFEIEDFAFMSGLIKWCDSYTRQGRLCFHVLKEFLSFGVYIKLDEQIYYYVKSVKFYFRKPKHRLKFEEERIQEFKDFISKKFKKGKPIFKDLTQQLNKEVRNSSQA